MKRIRLSDETDCQRLKVLKYITLIEQERKQMSGKKKKETNGSQDKEGHIFFGKRDKSS